MTADIRPFAPPDAEPCADTDFGAEQAPATEIRATPYRCKDPALLPRRPWIYGRQLLRGSLSVIVAPGGVGKTSLTVGTALALASGRPLLGKHVWDGPKRTWLWNLEDSALELSYLVEAARLHWGIAEKDLEGRLFLDSGLSGAELCVAVEDNTGFRIVEPVLAGLVDEIRSREIDVLVVDPFVSCHRVSENNNSAVDAIAKKWAWVSVQANCAVLLVHHTRKLNNAEATAELSRGAVALPYAARSVVALNRMSPVEAGQWGIEGEDRRRFFRAYDDKANRAPPGATSDWYQLASVSLGNGGDDEAGDSIQVVLPWTPPDAFAGVTADHLREVQGRLAAREYRYSVQSADWAGFVVAEVLGLDVEDDGPERKRVKELLKAWIASGALKKGETKDDKGRARPTIEVGILAEPDTSPL